MSEKNSVDENGPEYWGYPRCCRSTNTERSRVCRMIDCCTTRYSCLPWVSRLERFRLAWHPAYRLPKRLGNYHVTSVNIAVRTVPRMSGYLGYSLSRIPGSVSVVMKTRTEYSGCPVVDWLKYSVFQGTRGLVRLRVLAVTSR